MFYFSVYLGVNLFVDCNIPRTVVYLYVRYHTSANCLKLYFSFVFKILFLKAPNVCKPMQSLIFTKSKSTILFESPSGEAFLFSLFCSTFSVPICSDQTSEVYFPPVSTFCTHGDRYGFRFICSQRTSSLVCRRACGILKQLSAPSSPPTLSIVCQTANLLQK